jgi:hypothetical protein
MLRTAPAAAIVASVAAALLVFLVGWVVALNEPAALATAPLAASLALQVAGLVIAVTGAAAIVLSAIAGERSDRLLPWAMVFLTGALLREPQWGLALAFAVVALAATTANWWPGRTTG